MSKLRPEDTWSIPPAKLDPNLEPNVLAFPSRKLRDKIWNRNPGFKVS